MIARKTFSERDICTKFITHALKRAKWDKLVQKLEEVSFTDEKIMFRESYVFEFLNLPEQYSKSDLQKGLIKQMKNFIRELGKDFLFVGEEYRLQVGNNIKK